MNLRLFSLAPLALALALSACAPRTTPPDEAAVFATIHENLAAMEKKDSAAVMETVHPASPDFADTKEIVEGIFKDLDLKYTLSDLKIVSATPDEVKVSFVQKTEKVGGAAAFPGTLTEGVHTLKLDHGKWKLFKTVPTKVLPLSEIKP